MARHRHADTTRQTGHEPDRSDGGGVRARSPCLRVQRVRHLDANSSARTPSPPDPSLPALLRAFHERLPVPAGPRNAVLALPDDRLLYLVAILRDTPTPAPAMTPEE